MKVTQEIGAGDGLDVWAQSGQAESVGDENRLPTVSETKTPGMEKDGPMPRFPAGFLWFK